MRAVHTKSTILFKIATKCLCKFITIEERASDGTNVDHLSFIHLCNTRGAPLSIILAYYCIWRARSSFSSIGSQHIYIYILWEYLFFIMSIFAHLWCFYFWIVFTLLLTLHVEIAATVWVHLQHLNREYHKCSYLTKSSLYRGTFVHSSTSLSRFFLSFRSSLTIIVHARELLLNTSDTERR